MGQVFAGNFAFQLAGRAGYDIAIPIKNMELTIAPSVAVGALLANSSAFMLRFTAEGRFFPIENVGFFAYFRPAEFNIYINENTTWAYQMTLGAGYAF